MGKVIKFPFGNQEEPEKNQSNSSQSISSSPKDLKKKLKERKKEKIRAIYEKKPFEWNVKEGIEEHVLQNFAVKNVLGLDVVYKENEKKEIGVLGLLSYEHKRRPGIFNADFIAKGHIDKDGKVVIDELAFRAGEPEYYNTITKILKAKKILPDIKGV
ncbi:MAG: hypothetical protein GXO21_06340 [Aquificae bacterium]|nr:hypothetical protein [Aquificota bacterium]